MNQFKTAIIGGFGSAFAFGTAAVSVEARIEIWLRLGALLAGLISALVTIYWLNRMNRMNVSKLEIELCDLCKAGHRPLNCPLSEDKRPDDCPQSKKMNKLKFLVCAALLLSGCNTTPERVALTITNAQVIAVDSAMASWALYAKTGRANPKQIEQVKRAYEVYYAAALVEKAAWLGYVERDKTKADIDQAAEVLLKARGALLNLVMVLLEDSGERFSAPREAGQTVPALTRQDVEWAFALLRPWEDYGIQ